MICICKNQSIFLCGLCTSFLCIPVVPTSSVLVWVCLSQLVHNYKSERTCVNLCFRDDDPRRFPKYVIRQTNFSVIWTTVVFWEVGLVQFSQCLPVQLEHLHALPECWMSANCRNEAISLWGWAVLNKQEQQGRVLHWAICGSTLARSAAVFTTLIAGRRTEMTFG